MKRFITNLINAILFMIMVTVSGLISGLYVSSSSDDLSKNVLLAKTIEESYAVEKVEENFYRENIPEEFFDVFWYYTKERPELRPSIYAIMKHESGNFRWTEYGRRNHDGSRDYTVMQVNSNNLKNKMFVKRYSAKDKSHIKSYYDEVVVMGINYFYELYDRYGENAYACYNGGPKSDRLLKMGQDCPKSYKNFVRIVSNYKNSVERIVKDAKFDMMVARNTILYGDGYVDSNVDVILTLIK